MAYQYSSHTSRWLPWPTWQRGMGIANIVKIWTIWLVDTYRILYTNWTYSDYEVTNWIAWGWDALTSFPLSQFASTTSLELKNVISDETGSGALVFANSPALITPTGIVKGDVGLWSVDNTADSAKPVSTAQQTALNSKEDTSNKSTSVTTDQASNTKYPSVKSVYDWATWLFATISNLALKAPIASPTFTGTVILPTWLTWVIRTDAGVVSVDTDVTDIVAASSTTVAGKVELATTAEINTWTDSTRAMPVDQYVASNRNVRYFDIYAIEKATDNAVGTNIIGAIECPFTGTITEIGAYVETAGVTGASVWDVNKNGTTIMTTNKLSIDSAEVSTRTAATAPTLTTTAITAGDLITIDTDSLSTTKPKGLHVRIWIRLT